MLTSAVRLALDGERIGKAETEERERIERGAPARMIAVECVPEEPQEPHLRALFEEIKKTALLPNVRNDVRTLALWPDYLIEARKRFAPIIAGRAYQERAERLYEWARKEALDLPCPIPLSREKLKAAGQEVEKVAALTMQFEHAYPRFILDIVLLERDWKETDALLSSPFPASTRPAVLAGGVE